MAIRIINADAFDGLRQIEDESVHCVVTSPPYWGLRSYLDADHPDKPREIGQEPTITDHIEVLVRLFREVRRVLRKDGVVWLNYGDAYCSVGHKKSSSGYGTTGLAGAKAQEHHPLGRENDARDIGLKHKDLMLMPARLAIALCDDGWWLRSEVIWAKPNPMPESVTDRPTNSHEKVFLLTKSPRYFYDAEAVKEASITNDMRRPYGSEGSWQLDGRPAEQRPNGKIRKALSWQERKDAGEPIRRGDPGETGWATPGGNVGEGGLSRNMRNVWTVATQPFSEAHFATFPAELAKRCIKSGTSERGCCSKCGAPWVRNMVRSEEVDESHKGSRFDKGKTGARDGGERTRNGERFKKVASGWSAGCDCEAGVAPCVVLDPFGGAGTTGLVADRLGRDAILVELNSMYAAMAERRIGKDAPLFASVCVEKVG